MPVISMFFGIIIQMYLHDNKRHHLPHLHVSYQDYTTVFSINDCSILEGNLPSKQRRLVEAWMELHMDELLADWTFAINGQEIYKIDPLRT